MQKPTSTPTLTVEQAAVASRILADLTRAWADPHKRDTIRQIVGLGPGDAHEDMQSLYAARATLTDRATSYQQRVQRLLTDVTADANLLQTNAAP